MPLPDSDGRTHPHPSVMAPSSLRKPARRGHSPKKGRTNSKRRPEGKDMFSPARRSEIMSNIRGRDTKPELRVRSLLHGLGYRFRLHRRDLPGRPDIVLPAHKVAVLVHGCWWHLHRGCPAGRLPTANRSFWKRKLEDNRERDRLNLIRLRRAGWRTVVLWECDIENDLERVSRRLLRVLAPTADPGQ